MNRREFLSRSAAAASALGAAAFGAACSRQGEDGEPRRTQGAEPTARYASGFTTAAGFRLQSPGKAWSYQETHVDAGVRCERFELREGDQWADDTERFGDGRQRVTLRGMTRYPSHEDVWFSYSFRWSGSMPDSWSNVTELHSSLEEDETRGKPPPFSLGISGGEFSLLTRSDRRATTTSEVDAVQRHTMPLFPKDTWQHVVVRIRFDPRGDGRLTFWLNGRREFHGGSISIGYNDDQGPYFKYGLYRGASGLTTVAEFANVDIGTATLRNRISNPEPLPA